MYKEVYGMKIEIVRFYNVYGPKEIVDGDWAAIIGIWRREIRNGEPLTIVGDGEQRRDFTHVHDIIDGLIKISESNKSHYDAWELGSGKKYSINEVFKMFSEKFNCKRKYIPNQNGNYRETLREHSDAIQMLGWNPEDRLRKYIMEL